MEQNHIPVCLLSVEFTWQLILKAKKIGTNICYQRSLLLSKTGYDQFNFPQEKRYHGKRAFVPIDSTFFFLQLSFCLSGEKSRNKNRRKKQKQKPQAMRTLTNK